MVKPTESRETPSDLDKFRDFYGKYAFSQQIASGLGSENANDRTSARAYLKQKMGMPEHVVPAQEAYDTRATAEEKAAGETLEGFFKERKDSIIDSLPRKSLEAMALEIQPIEFPTNRHYSPEHNSLVKIHNAYLGIRGLNQGFVNKKVPYADYSAHMSQIAAKEITEQMSQNKYLGKQTIALFASAQAQLIGSSEIAAFSVGRKVESETKEKFMSKAKELANPERKDRVYTLSDYAGNNIRYNPNVGAAIAYANAVLEAKGNR